MTIAAGGAPRPPASPPEPFLRFAAAASALLHGAVLASLLIGWRSTALPRDTRPLEVELVQSQAMTPGDAPSQPTPPPQEGVGPTSPAPPPPPPEVHIGNGPDNSDPLTVTGDNVVPPEPDSRFRNQPPSYPPDAARAGAEGTVQLMIRVSAQGIPLEVRTVKSSGNQSLDSAAQRAVHRWRFRPALEGGRAVPFDYLLNIRFALGDHP